MKQVPNDKNKDMFRLWKSQMKGNSFKIMIALESRENGKQC
jgi:hypothetical protein